ncbi:MAG TPA: hypothetical protein PKO25_09915 [Spirochaetota bacterium]|nr:hypothetical protein [Spirochaetota bacterium]
MRADLEELLHSLLDLHGRKLTLVERLARSIADKLYYLKTGDTERLSLAVSEDSPLIELIDTLDFDIGAAMDRMAAIAGTDRIGVEKLLRAPGHTGASELLRIRARIGDEIANLVEVNDELVKGMEGLSSSILADAEALSRLRKVKPVSPP